MEMGAMHKTIAVSCLVVLLLWWAWRVLNWAWFKPKKLEKRLRQQGFKGNSYRFLVGDVKDSAAMLHDAMHKPITFCNDIVPRIMPHIHHTIKSYAMIRCNINALQDGISQCTMLPAFAICYDQLLSKWEKAASTEGAYEVDVFPTFDTLTSDVISRVAFGSNYVEGGKIFFLLKELIELTVQETTGILLTWTMVLLSKHPQWQERAREEVFQTFGRNNLDFERLNHLKVVTMILYEVLRLYPPVSDLTKIVHKETKLGEFSIPPGVQIMLPTVVLHRDNKIWGNDAMEFNPMRFSEGVANATKNNVSYFPFSWGPRVCIGQNFALLQAKLGLAMILQRFTFELSPSYAHAPMTILTLQPQHGAHVIYRKV
ncbi:hypothetical protein RJ639_020010 [Escallonia herrerae]|uniref:Cytochrome P450 n=1 Tax=Escallonia herrerae TaxID=1293975 RepID=A0AA88V7F3_9ASTE|nr:hypothetical protein RJ639_020010 [Escallonia herrerae]